MLSSNNKKLISEVIRKMKWDQLYAELTKLNQRPFKSRRESAYLYKILVNELKIKDAHNAFELSSSELDDLMCSYLSAKMEIKGVIEHCLLMYKKRKFDESKFNWLNESNSLDCYYIWYLVTTIHPFNKNSDYFSFNSESLELLGNYKRSAYTLLGFTLTTLPSTSTECKELILMFFDHAELSHNEKCGLVALLKKELSTFKLSNHKCFKALKGEDEEFTFWFWDYLITTKKKSTKPKIPSFFNPTTLDEVLIYSTIILYYADEDIVTKAYSSIQSKKSYCRSQPNIKISRTEFKKISKIAEAYGVNESIALKTLIDNEFKAISKS